MVEFLVTKEKQGIHGTPLSYENENWDPVPPHGNVRPPKLSSVYVAPLKLLLECVFGAVR